MERFLYFAYGSNMDLEQMRFRCPGEYDLLGIGKLEHWRFLINSRGYANIFPEQDATVFGLVFNLTPNALSSLDRYEGYPQLYTRRELPVIFADQMIEPWVYLDINNIDMGRPRPGYLERVTESAKRFAFPTGYIAYLDSYLGP